MRRPLSLAFLLLAACPKDDGKVDDTPHPVCESVTFADTSTKFSLPHFAGENWRDEVAFAMANAVAYRDCGGETEQALIYHIADYTGDGVPDLVVTYDGCESTGIGDSHWDIYGGTESGFLSSPIQWKVPQFEGEGWGHSAALSALGGQTWRTCNGDSESRFNYQVTDMNKDLVPDLVVSYDECDGSTIGNAVWHVYYGAAGGFELTPESWALPTSEGSNWNTVVPFIDFTSGAWRDCGGDPWADVYHTTLDLNRDGWVDLLLTYDTCIGDGLSSEYWLVYYGSDGGFAQEPEQWALPVREGEDWYEGVPYTTPDGASVRNCGEDTQMTMTWVVRDMDGDGLADFTILHDDCSGPSLGTDHWDFYPGDGTGFAATPTAWTLPTVPGENWNRGAPFTDVSDRDERDCDGGTDVVFRYEMFDLTTDGAEDLVVTVDPCGGAKIGEEFWQVYPGGSTGFATTPIEWALPPRDGITWSKDDVPYPEMNESSTRDCGDDDEAEFNYGMVTITADANPDLVVTYDACNAGAVGTDFWEVFPALCE